MSKKLDLIYFTNIFIAISFTATTRESRIDLNKINTSTNK